MKLLCINNRKISKPPFVCSGQGLEEGKIYTTKGKPFEEDGMMNYYIEGLGVKLCCRFTEVLEEDKAEIMISKLKEEFQLN